MQHPDIWELGMYLGFYCIFIGKLPLIQPGKKSILIKIEINNLDPKCSMARRTTWSHMHVSGTLDAYANIQNSRCMVLVLHIHNKRVRRR